MKAGQPHILTNTALRARPVQAALIMLGSAAFAVPTQSCSLTVQSLPNSILHRIAIVAKRDKDDGEPDKTAFLYFIALGLGILFTNIWVILGVRYCYRTRRRQRMIERGEISPDDTESMLEAQGIGGTEGFAYYLNPLGVGATTNQGPRRADRHVLTLEELDARFPVQKYWDWTKSQIAQGLPSEGGISKQAAGLSRSASVSRGDTGTVVDAHPVSTDSPLEDKETQAVYVEVADADPHPEPAPNLESNSAPAKTAVVTNVHEAVLDHESSGQPYETTMTNMLVDTDMCDSGDLCAVCIDTIESDNDIRALECHHVFHDACITPWLTTRKACCPLCKRNFYYKRRRRRSRRPTGTRRDSENPDADNDTLSQDGSEPRSSNGDDDGRSGSLSQPPRARIRARLFFRQLIGIHPMDENRVRYYM